MTSKSTWSRDWQGGKQSCAYALNQSSIFDYLEHCPFALKDDDPLFVGVRGKRLNPGLAQKHVRNVRKALNLQTQQHRMPFVIACYPSSIRRWFENYSGTSWHASLSTIALYICGWGALQSAYKMLILEHGSIHWQSDLNPNEINEFLIAQILNRERF